MSIPNVAIGGIEFGWPLVVAAAAALQWLCFAAFALWSRARMPKTGLRTVDRRLAWSSAGLAVVWIVACLPGPAAWRTHGPFSSAQPGASAAHTSSGSCWMIDAGVPSSEVEKKLGPPDERRSDEEIRGPGASLWIYRNSRCVVHIIDERVEFVD